MMAVLLQGKGDGPKRAGKRLRHRVAAVSALGENLSRLSTRYPPLPLSLRGGEFRSVFDRRLAELLANGATGVAATLAHVRSDFAAPPAFRVPRANDGPLLSPDGVGPLPAMPPHTGARGRAPSSLENADEGRHARDARPRAEIRRGDRRDTPWPDSRTEVRPRGEVALQRQSRFAQSLRGVALIRPYLAAYWDGQVRRNSAAAIREGESPHPVRSSSHDVRSVAAYDSRASGGLAWPPAGASLGREYSQLPTPETGSPERPGWEHDRATPPRDLVPHSPGARVPMDSDDDLSDRIADILYRQALQHGIDVT